MIKRKSGAAAKVGRITIDIELPSTSGRTDGVARPMRGSDHEAIADYLADMIAQLEGLARATNKEMLAYLLSMASIQAVAPEAGADGSTLLH